MNLSPMNSCRSSSLVALALLSILSLTDISFACAGEGCRGRDEPGRQPRADPCGSMRCLNGGTCGPTMSSVEESALGSGSSMGDLMEGEAPLAPEAPGKAMEDLVCACVPGYTGPDCSVQIECRLEGCKVCDSTMESCDECFQENGNFDQSLKRCIVDKPMDPNDSSGQNIEVIVIIICALVAAVIVAIVVGIVSVVYYRRRKRNKMFKLKYEVARSDSAELFDRIHTTFSVPAGNTDTSTYAPNIETDEGDAREDGTDETKTAEAEASKDDKMAEEEISSGETKKEEADTGKDDTKKEGEADESKDDTSKSTLAMVDTSKEDTTVAVAEDKSKETTVDNVDDKATEAKVDESQAETRV